MYIYRDCIGLNLSRFSCNFGPEDNSHIYIKDLKGLLQAEQQRRKRRVTTAVEKKRKGKKVIPDFNVMCTDRSTGQKKPRIGQKAAGMSRKRGCQRHFLAKQNYMDTTLCQLVYKVTEHVNVHGELCHGVTVAGFKHSMGTSLSENMKNKLGSMLDMGLTSTQVMIQHKAWVMEMALTNAPVSRDMFVQAHDVRNIANKRAQETWMKHKKETVSIRLWKDENIKEVFFYQEHGLLDVNKKEQEDSPFTLGFQTVWQKTMLVKFGHQSAISIDATFDTSHSRVSIV